MLPADQITHRTMIAADVVTASVVYVIVTSAPILKRNYPENIVNVITSHVTEIMDFCALDPHKELVSVVFVFVHPDGQDQLAIVNHPMTLVFHLMGVKFVQVMVPVNVVVAGEFYKILQAQYEYKSYFIIFSDAM